MRTVTAVWAVRTIGNDRRAHRRQTQPRPVDRKGDASVATVARENPTAMTVVLTPPARWVSLFFYRLFIFIFIYLFAYYYSIVLFFFSFFSPPTCRHLFLVEWRMSDWLNDYFAFNWFIFNCPFLALSSVSRFLEEVNPECDNVLTYSHHLDLTCSYSVALKKKRMIITDYGF